MFDLHVHSHHSCDAHATMMSMAQAAHAAGLEGLAFTEHVEWLPGDEATGFLNCAAYFAELTALREQWEGRLEVLAGVEIGSTHLFPEETRAFLAARPWDYVLGSAHWVEGVPGWLPAGFADGIQAAYARYFRELVRLAREGEYDVLAHFDLVRRDSWAQLQQTLPLEQFAADIDAALQAVVARGKGLEINTSPLGNGLAEPCPGLYILRRYRALGGEVLVFGSDAHQTQRVGQHFEAARQLALAAGFTRLARYRERRRVGWIPL